MQHAGRTLLGNLNSTLID